MSRSISQSFDYQDLQRLVENQDVTGLVDALDYEKVQRSKGIRSRIVDELGLLGDPAAAKRICDVLERDTDAPARGLAAKALGRLGNSDVIPVLLGSLEGETRANQMWIIWSLGKLKARDGVDDLVRLLYESEIAGVRQFAAQALGEIGDQRATTPLINALGDPKGRVQRAAADALGRLGDSRAYEPVCVAYENAGFFARRRIRRALVELESRFA